MSHWLKPGDYWLARLALERSVAGLFLVAFLNVVNRLNPLLGEGGLWRVPLFVRRVDPKESRSLFFYFPNDTAFTICGWIGVGLSLAILSGLLDRWTWALFPMWAVIWALY